MECEECQENEAEKPVIIDGGIKRLCSKCAAVSGGVLIEKPSSNQIDESKRLWRVREMLSKSAGIPYSPKPVNLPPTLRTVSLEDLRRVNTDKKSVYQQRAENRMKREDELAAQKNGAGKIIEESKAIKDEIELIDE